MIREGKMKDFDRKILTNLFIPEDKSHKGQNGRLLIIGGSHLFHSASLWSLKVASRIVDLVHYSSVPENNAIVAKLKEEFRDGIVVPRAEIESYIEEDDCILIGPGMVRAKSAELSNYPINPASPAGRQLSNLKEIIKLGNEGVQTYFLTKYLLQKYPKKKWVIDAGALQMMEPEWITSTMIITPHHGEFETLKLKIKNEKLKMTMKNLDIADQIYLFAKEFGCAVLHKGQTDYVCNRKECYRVKGGNAGMTKGGTGDVLAGLTAAFYCKNEALTSAASASFINKKSGEDLYQTKGYWFNASDLADQIPKTMKKLLL
ncbi:NAD(P)H-hydrate dehydratase [Candidatus Gottesmanbacteria bacterium]|nr:NAD(P)H-hydrate dehydratase [Candidatus Gottesmanbacteria bacterium]